MSKVIPDLSLMMALGALKRKDAPAFDVLLKKLGVDKWSKIQATQYGDVIATCSAATGRTFERPEMPDAEVADVLSGDAEDNATLRAVYEAAYGKAPPIKDLAAHAHGDTVAERLDSMGRFDNAARKVAANAKRES